MLQAELNTAPADSWSIVELSELKGQDYLAPEGSLHERPFTSRHDAWTIEDDERLTSLFRSDQPLQAIEEALGRTKYAVRTRLYNLGLRRNTSLPWTEEEDSEMILRYGHVVTADLARDLGRSVSALYARASILGLTAPPDLEWTEWEDRQVVEGYKGGVPLSVLSKITGRSVSAISTRASKHLKITHAHEAEHWTDAEDQLLIACVAKERPEKDIVRAFKNAGFDRTQAAIAGRKARFGLHLPRNMPWSAEEDQILIAGYEANDRLEDIAARVGRPAGGLSWRARQLGIRHPNPDGFRDGPVWTEEDIEVLKANYNKMPAAELAELLGRSKSAVHSRAHTMGITGGYHTVFTIEDYREIQKRDIEGGPKAVKAYALQRGWNWEVACRKAKKIREGATPASLLPKRRGKQKSA